MELGGPIRIRETAQLAGVRSLAGLRPDEAVDLGEEGQALARLAAAGVPIIEGWLVRLSTDGASARLADLVRRGLDEGPGAVRLRPLFPSRAAAIRFERRAGTIADVAGEDEVEQRVGELLEALGSTDVTAALGGSLASLHVRVVPCDGVPSGRAASADPVTGDPDEISVWTHTAAARWRIDRKTARVVGEGEGDLNAAEASVVGDLADRAQLVLGRPVELEWASRGGRFAVVGLRPLSVRPTFTAGSWRIVALVAPDEGTVAPLAIDALDHALGRAGDADEARVRRIYGRPYRRADVDTDGGRVAADPVSLARAAARAARVAADVTTSIAAARTFERGLARRLADIDRADVAALDDEHLLAAIRERQRLAIEALTLLERTRLATKAVLASLEATVGALPRECFPALAAPRDTRARKRTHERLARFARRIESDMGELAPRAVLPLPMQKRWDELRQTVADCRALGIDVRPDAYGSSDAALLEALRAARHVDGEARERARRDAARRVAATARSKALGRSREAIATSLLVLLSRLAGAKGSVAEGLAAALLRLRRAATVAGGRLVDADVLDRPDDALYLHLIELEDALVGEPGAYAARVQLRREDDQRWARYEAPRRIEGR